MFLNVVVICIDIYAEHGTVKMPCPLIRGPHPRSPAKKSILNLISELNLPMYGLLSQNPSGYKLSLVSDLFWRSLSHVPKEESKYYLDISWI